MLIGEGLADIRQSEMPAMSVMQIIYPGFALFLFNSQHIREITGASLLLSLRDPLYFY